jgi:hypothetical protein
MAAFAGLADNLGREITRAVLSAIPGADRELLEAVATKAALEHFGLSFN